MASHCVVKKSSSELVYHIGGRYRAGKKVGKIGDITEYNSTSNSFRTLENKLKDPRSAHGCVMMEEVDKILVAGGGGEGARPPRANTVEIFDIVSGQWTAGQSLESIKFKAYINVRGAMVVLGIESTLINKYDQPEDKWIMWNGTQFTGFDKTLMTAKMFIIETGVIENLEICPNNVVGE